MTYPSLRVVSGTAVLKEKLSHLYAARRRGEADVFAAGFAEDGVFHILGDSRLIPEAGPRQGRRAVASVINQCYRNYEYVDALVVDVIADINHACIRRHLTLRSRETGAVGDFDVMDFIRFRDGEIVELVQFIDTASLAVLCGRV